ncbi:hypothetical protein [Eubacterium sp.]|uniref:hypothetical protein n=1 Tax=Eubacterium sp. TaxID=142586 RepID=UPI0035202623
MDLMQNALCMCCSDYCRYCRKRNEVTEKVNLLTRIVHIQDINVEEYRKFRSKYSKEIHIIQMDSIHLHFMCGVCRKVNSNDIKIKEDQLRNLLWKVFFLIYTSEDELLYSNTLRILQGDYPITYRNLKRVWQTRKRCLE